MTQPRSRVDLYAAIRRDARSGMSNRALQRKHGVGFRTVTAALESAWPKERKQPSKRGSRLDAYRVVIDDWLRSDVDAPRKQRHTAKRIFDRLLDEHDGAGGSPWLPSRSPSISMLRPKRRLRRDLILSDPVSRPKLLTRGRCRDLRKRNHGTRSRTSAEV